MSIQTEINRIQSNVNDSLQVVAGYGVNVPEGANSNNLPQLIGEIGGVIDARVLEIIENSLSLGIASDGRLYIFVDGSPVGTGIEQGAIADVYGYIDENNHITLKGVKEGGTYTFAFVMDDNSTIYGGEFEYDDNVYYTVTNYLTNCSNSNSEKTVVEGERYFAEISANSGYELKSVSVTMGGSPVSVSGGVINISSVTGNIVITAVAEENKPTYTNLANPNDANWKENTRINSSYAEKQDSNSTNMVTTNYIEVKSGDVIRVKNIDFKATNYISYSKIIQYNNGTPVNALTPTGNATEFVVDGNGITTITVKSATPWSSGTHIRLSGKLIGTSADVIITKNEEIV